MQPYVELTRDELIRLLMYRDERVEQLVGEVGLLRAKVRTSLKLMAEEPRRERGGHGTIAP